MATKAKTPHVVNETLLDGMTREEMVATITISPEVQAAFTIHVFEDSKIELNGTIKELRSQIGAVHGGSMKRPEAMLVAQSHTLDELFNQLAKRSYANMKEGFGEAAERYMKLALRAQNQCRTTLEALSAIKNPPVVFAKQMNVSHGPQQVNNGVATNTQPMASDVARTLENETEQNKLLEAHHVASLDTGTKKAPIYVDRHMEAVGEIHRAENRGR